MGLKKLQDAIQIIATKHFSKVMRFLIFFIKMSDVAEMDGHHFKQAEGQTPFNDTGVWSYFFFFPSLQ